MSKKKKKQSNSWIISLLLFILRVALVVLIAMAIVKLGRFTYNLGYSVASDTPMDEEPGRDISVVISTSMSEKQIAKLLESKGLIESAGIFRVQLKVFDYDGTLRAGSYVLNTSMAPSEIMAVLAGEELSDEDAEE